MAHTERLNEVRPLYTEAAHDDRELADRACEGDRWAKEMLYRRHAQRLVALATRLLGSQADAEDSVQDAFVEAFRDLHSLRDRASIGRWLTRITVHQVHRRFRRRALHRLVGLDQNRDEVQGLVERACPELSPDLRTELALLDDVLRTLPAKQKIPWLLRYVEGYTLEEVAVACACSLASAKRRIQRAHAVLTKHVKIQESSNE